MSPESVFTVVKTQAIAMHRTELIGISFSCLLSLIYQVLLDN